MPAGMDAPKVTAVRRVFAKAVSRRRKTMDDVLEALCQTRRQRCRHQMNRRVHSLAESVCVDAAAVLEQVHDEFG